jgi:hypothetical protein
MAGAHLHSAWLCLRPLKQPHMLQGEDDAQVCLAHVHLSKCLRQHSLHCCVAIVPCCWQVCGITQHSCLLHLYCDVHAAGRYIVQWHDWPVLLIVQEQRCIWPQNTLPLGGPVDGISYII